MWVFGIIFVLALGGTLVGSYYMKGSSAEQDITHGIVSRTEYVPLDDGQVISEIRFALSFTPVPATCYASVFYPNKTVFISDWVMTPQNSTGTQYVNFTVPSVEGVYEYQSRCEYNNRNYTTSKAFHVSSAFRRTQERLDLLPDVNWLNMGVEETRLNEWAVNSWRLEGQGYITGVDCQIQEAPLFAEGQISNEPLMDYACQIAKQSGGGFWGGYYFGASAGSGDNYVGRINNSQCVGTNCPSPFVPGDSSDPQYQFLDMYVGDDWAWWLVDDLASLPEAQETGLYAWAYMGNFSYTYPSAYPSNDFELIDCGLQGPEPNWTVFTEGQHLSANKVIGGVYCLITDEGYLVKIQVEDSLDYNQAKFDSPADDCFTCTLLFRGQIWAGCTEGSFIENDEKWVGYHWYANSTKFDNGQNYEITCDIDYDLDNVSYDYDGLRQYVMINHPRLRAVHVK